MAGRCCLISRRVHLNIMFDICVNVQNSDLQSADIRKGSGSKLKEKRRKTEIFGRSRRWNKSLSLCLVVLACGAREEKGGKNG